MRGHIRYDSSKGDVRPVLSTKCHFRAKGDAVEAIFFAVEAIFLCHSNFTVFNNRSFNDRSIIVLVFGSALLVVLSKSSIAEAF